MKRFYNNILYFLFFMGLLCLPASALAGFDEGKAAFESEDYSVALREFRPLAEEGHGGAQFYLGTCFAKGFGVERDNNEAAKWYIKSAEQGDMDSQYAIGFMYFKGHGVNKNYLAGFQWNILAALQGQKKAENLLVIITLAIIAGLFFQIFILRFVTKRRAGFKPSLISALWIEVLGMVALSLVFDLALSVLVSSKAVMQPFLTGLPGIIARKTGGVILMTVIYGRLLKDPKSGPIGLMKGFYISATITAIEIAFSVAITILAVVFGVLFLSFR